ncbi:MAG: UDP-N-acetylmuramoyl-L-alanine--D-glutamate ligase, partial [Oscillospiraceae bacterium]|nr:UDP-N-acetylmuramoyl-L-alanine--D-glutamate ligase [Oscillospiraceae bacterium]
VSVETMYSVAKNFGGVEHRIELCREFEGVKWYNDSIATSPTRTIAGLSCFDQKVILLAGGYDKNIPYAPLAPSLIEKVKLLILCGATAPKIAEALQNHPDYDGTPEMIFVEDMEEAVSTAYAYAEEGDIVTLSPASASFDRYKNFEIRGKHFKELVSKIGQVEGLSAEELWPDYKI